MKWSSVIAGILGMGVAGWLLYNYGIGRIFDLIGHAGWYGVLAVIAFHTVQILCSGLGWRAIVGPQTRRPTPSGYWILRWIRESVNNLLPLMQVGGEFLAGRLLQRQGVPTAVAIAGTFADLTLEMATQVAFTLLGLTLLLRGVGNAGIAGYVIGGLLLASLIVAGCFGAVWLGGAAAIETALLRFGRFIGWTGAARVEGLNDALLGCYRARGRATLAAFWHLASWLLGGLEVCLALHFLKVDVGIGSGLIIESLGQAVKALGFAVPGAVGVQEGGYIVVCHALGLSPDIAIALSLLKRLREVALGVPGLILWLHLEAKGGAAPTPLVAGSRR